MYNATITGERIKKLRGKKPQDQCAKELGISRGALSYYENGERKPDAEILYRMAEYFKVSVDYLLGLTKEQTIEPDIKIACEVTGLSGEAIKKIAQLKTKINLSANCGKGLKVTGTEIMNSLILDKWFEAFMQRLAMYYIRTRAIVYMVIENKSISFNIDIVEYEKTLAKLALFEVGQAANLIAENFKSPHFEEAVSIIDKLKTEFEKEASENAEHNPKKE